MKKILLMLILSLAVAFVLPGCSDDQKSEQQKQAEKVRTGPKDLK